MMGATSEDPLLSSVDLTFSPIYSSATTSGTSNCPNWDIALQERFARWQFLVANQSILEEEIATGHGPHSEALGALYYCSEVVNSSLAISCGCIRKGLIFIYTILVK